MQKISTGLLTLLLAACGSTGSVSPTTGELQTQPSVELTQSTGASAETLGGAGALYLFGHPQKSFGFARENFSQFHRSRALHYLRSLCSELEY